jgi:myo-inositol-1(or 4)-monophosphatase
MKDAVPVLAGAYLPAQEMLYLAEKGKGSSVNDRPLIIGNRELKDSLAAFSTDYSRDEHALQQALRIYAYLVQHARNVRSTNSLLDLIYVAEGKFGGCINMFTCIWDIASMYLIITEAGGVFKSLAFNDIAFSIDGESIRRNYPIITGNNLFIEQVFKAIG